MIDQSPNALTSSAVTEGPVAEAVDQIPEVGPWAGDHRIRIPSHLLRHHQQRAGAVGPRVVGEAEALVTVEIAPMLTAVHEEGDQDEEPEGIKIGMSLFERNFLFNV